MFTKLSHFSSLTSISVMKTGVKYFSTGKSPITLLQSTLEHQKHFETLSNIIDKSFNYDGKCLIGKLYFGDDLIGNTIVNSNYQYMDLGYRFPNIVYKDPTKFLDEEIFNDFFSTGFLVLKPGCGSPLDGLVLTREEDGTLIGVDTKYSVTPKPFTDTLSDLYISHERALNVFRYIGKGGERNMKTLFPPITNRELGEENDLLKKKTKLITSPFGTLQLENNEEK